MGNRAVITDKERSIALYLHWNGGRDSVESFVEYCRLKRYREPGRDSGYAFARLSQVVGNFFKGTLSVGVMPYTDDESMARMADDNGVYVLDGWEIVDRVYPWEDFLEQDRYSRSDMLRAIDKRQPPAEQLGDFLDAVYALPSELSVGDRVWVYDEFRCYEGEFAAGYKLCTVLGFGNGCIYGQDVTGIPYVNPREDDPGFTSDPSKSISNYITDHAYLAK